MPDQQTRGQLSVIASGRWDRAVLTTFTLNLNFFESYLLPALHKSGCDDITVLVDERAYVLSLQESSARAVGTNYRLFPVRLDDGIFHAKLTYLEGRSEDILMVGSGNLTAQGFGRQLECLDVLRSSVTPIVFSQFARLLEELTASPTSHLGPAERAIRTLIERAEGRGRGAAVEVAPEIQLLGSMGQGLVAQLTAALRNDAPFSKIIALSPFHSEHAAPLRELAAQLGAKKVLVAVDPRTKETPVGDGIKSVAFVEMIEPSESRPAHAKWYEFHGQQVWLACGSANATDQSLNTTKNFEVLSLRRIPPAALPRWRTTQPAETGVKPPPIGGAAGTHALIGSVEGERAIRGQFLSPGDVDGSWQASLQAENVIYSIGSVNVSQGTFGARIPAGCEIDGLTSCQLWLRRADEQASGWLHFADALSMSREQRDFVRRLRKLTTAEAEHDDFLHILGWLASQVGSFTTGGAKGDTARTVDGTAESDTAPVARFDYGKYVAGARDAPTLHLGRLGQVRAALQALGHYRSRRSLQPGPVQGIPNEVEDVDSEAAGRSPILDSEQSTEEAAEEDLLRRLRIALERQLGSGALDTQTSFVFLEALLWALVAENRHNRLVPLDAIPFIQWRAEAEKAWRQLRAEQGFAALCVAAMSCAWSLRENDDARMEQVANLAQDAARLLPPGHRDAVVLRALETCPAFHELSAPQMTSAKDAIQAVLRYRGFRQQLRDFLDEWRDEPSTKPSEELRLKTRLLVDELTRWRQQREAVTEWTTSVPDVCRCYCRFPDSDLPVIRNCRAIKCRTCGRLHFWTGTRDDAA